MLLREPREAAVPVPSLSGPRRLWFPARRLARLKGFNCIQVREAFDFFPKLARRFWLPRGPPGLPRLGVLSLCLRVVLWLLLCRAPLGSRLPKVGPTNPLLCVTSLPLRNIRFLKAVLAGPPVLRPRFHVLPRASPWMIGCQAW